MPAFTIETTYRLPVYRRRKYHAATLAEACRLAIEDDDWSGQKEDHDCAGETYVSASWSAEDGPHSVQELPVPTQFGETLQRKAEHFDELLEQLAFVAQPMGLSRVDFERWLPKAEATVRKARAILAGQRDPDDAGGTP
jgi:hypothetical protein